MWELPEFREQVTKLPEPVTRPLLGAMRALLVITPRGDDSLLFDGFDPKLWNTA